MCIRDRRYATSDVDEVAGLARLLGGAAFALARMAPRRYEPVSYTHLRAHETVLDIVCRLLLEKTKLQ